MRLLAGCLHAACLLASALLVAGVAQAASAAAGGEATQPAAETLRVRAQLAAQLPALSDPAHIAVALLATARWPQPQPAPATGRIEALRRDALARIDLTRADATTLLLLLALPDDSRDLPALPERKALAARLKPLAGRSMSAWIALLPALPGEADTLLDGAAASADDRHYETVLALAHDLYTRAMPGDAAAAAYRTFGLAGLTLPLWAGWFEVCAVDDRRARCQALATTLACSDRNLLNVSIGTDLLQRLARTPQEIDQAERLRRWRNALMDAPAPDEARAHEWLERVVAQGEVAALAAAARAAGGDPGPHPCDR